MQPSAAFVWMDVRQRRGVAKLLLAGEVHDGDVVPVNVSADGEALILG